MLPSIVVCQYNVDCHVASIIAELHVWILTITAWILGGIVELFPWVCAKALAHPMVVAVHLQHIMSFEDLDGGNNQTG